MVYVHSEVASHWRFGLLYLQRPGRPVLPLSAIKIQTCGFSVPPPFLIYPVILSERYIGDVLFGNTDWIEQRKPRRFIFQPFPGECYQYKNLPWFIISQLLCSLLAVFEGDIWKHQTSWFRLAWSGAGYTVALHAPYSLVSEYWYEDGYPLLMSSKGVGTWGW